jgi:hypothetical protein
MVVRGHQQRPTLQVLVEQLELAVLERMVGPATITASASSGTAASFASRSPRR